jgi:hypothetical protein
MAAVKDKKLVPAPFPNDIKPVKVYYDFSVDGGATGDLDLIEADDDIVIMGVWAKVVTACASGGSAAVSSGISSDKDALIDSVAVASLTEGSFHKTPMVEGTPNTFAVPLKLAAGEKITQTIETAALTAGKIEYTFIVARF